MTRWIEKWDYFEVEYNADTKVNPFLDVRFEADFSRNHRTIKIAGFYDGDDIYKLRFMPDTEGIWHFTTRSNIPALNGQQGEFECIPPTGTNHGPVRVHNRTHFAYADGTPYYPVGTTCYVWNHQGEALEEQTLATLKTAPFNKMRMCVFPKRYSFNRNEPPGYPFKGEVSGTWEPSQVKSFRRQPPPDYWDFHYFNPAYFQHLERRILDLRAMGVEADLILFHPYDFGAWGFDRMPSDVNDRYLQYLTARVSAFRNVWWSFANEYDLMIERTLADWDHYFKLVQENDPYDHLRSIHNCFGFYDHRKPWVTHCSIQHANLSEVRTWLCQYDKPVIVDECGYEGDIGFLWGSLSPEEMVVRFWIGFAMGGYVGHGETYVNDEEVLWWSKGGTLSGESVPRIAFLRQIIETVPAPGLAPFPPPPSNPDGLEFSQPPLVAGGMWNMVSGGHIGTDYYLFYFGMHQPRFREFNLPEGSYRVDIIDTWNMTIDRVMDNASGLTTVELPRRKYMAIRIERNL
jgi:hypothetical protein